MKNKLSYIGGSKNQVQLSNIINNLFVLVYFFIYETIHNVLVSPRKILIMNV